MKKPLKGVLLVYPVENISANRGVFEKMIGQAEAYHALNHCVFQCYIENGRILLKKHQEKEALLISSINSPRWNKYAGIFNTINRQWLKEHVRIVHIRHLLFTDRLHSFVSLLKEEGIQTVYEFPTYPYFQEWMNSYKKAFLLMDKAFKKTTLKKVDLVLHYGGFEGAPNLKITNGIRLLPNINSKTKSKKFKLISIAKTANWHGLDRIIAGLKNYKKDIQIDIVGTGPDTNKLKKLTSKLNLMDRVNFLPEMFGQDLQKALKQAHIGIGTMALHRKNVIVDSSLKHRRYCLSGLPFILSSEDEDFPRSFPFIYYVPNDNSPIDLSEVSNWYNELGDISNIEQDMINYAKENLDWKSRIFKVIEVLDKSIP